MVKKISIWLILEPLLYAESKHLADLSRELNVPHPTLRKHLAIFEKIGLLVKEKKGRQVFYKIRKIPLLLDYLVIVEKERLIKRCNEELVLKELVDFLHSFSNPVLIFGSAVRSLEDAKDVDLLIIGRFNDRDLKKIEKKLNLNLHVINVRSLREISNALKVEIVRKHLIVQGSEELIKWMIS